MNISLILNLFFAIVLVIGFLFGLHGLKKSSLSLAFFIGAFIVSLLLTPVITRAILNISINIDGTRISISDFIINAIKTSPVVQELASSGSNLEALIQNAPTIIGNIVVYMALLIVVGLLFWIAYLITAHCIFKKPKKEKQNKVGKHTPENISATGNVKYVKVEQPEKKHRLLGGLVAALHSLIFVVALLIPVVGATSLINNYAYSTESDSQTTASITLDINANQSGNDSVTYTPTAKLLQENLPQELLELTGAINNSILGNLCQIADSQNIIFNNITKCNVNGVKVVLKDEIDNVVTIYDNVEFLSDINFEDIDSIKSINFNKIRKAVNALTDSNILKSVFPELVTKYIDWITEDDISNLTPEIQNMINGTREQLDEEPNLKEMIIEIKSMLSSEEKVIKLLKGELLKAVDLCEIVVTSDLMDLLMDTENVTENQIIEVLHANNNKLLNSIIDKIFESDFVNVISLTGLNYTIDYAQELLSNQIGEAVSISKIVLKDAQNRFDTSIIKDTANIILDTYTSLQESEDNGNYDIEQFLKANIVNLATNIGKVIDDIKNMPILNEFGTFEDILTALDKFEVTIMNDEPKNISQSLLNLSLLLDKNFSVQQELEQMATSIKNTLDIQFVEQVNNETVTYSFFDKVMSGEYEYIIKNLTSEQLTTIVNILTNSELFKPFSVTVLNVANKFIQENISEELGDFVEFLPEDIDLTEANEEIVTIIEDVKNVMIIVDKFDDNKDVTENLKALEDEDKNKIVNVLNDLQDSANNDGIFKQVFEQVVEFAQDDEKTGLEGLSAIIQEYTSVDENGKTQYDWARIVGKFLQDN